MKQRLIYLILFFGLWAWADEPPEPQINPPVESAPPAVNDSSSEEGEAVPKPSKKRKVIGEKEADGTKAPKLIKESIPKSKYELNGQALEVDTD